MLFYNSTFSYWPFIYMDLTCSISFPETGKNLNENAKGYNKQKTKGLQDELTRKTSNSLV
jgi:hypothetical protein